MSLQTEAALNDALIDEDEDTGDLDDLLDQLMPSLMVRFDAEFRSETTLCEDDAKRAVTNSTRHDCVAWMVGDQWKVGDNLPDGYVGRYFSKGAFGTAVCHWSTGVRDVVGESIYRDHERGFTLD